MVDKFTVMQLLVTCADTAIHFLIVMLKIILTVLYLVCYSSEAHYTLILIKCLLNTIQRRNFQETIIFHIGIRTSKFVYPQKFALVNVCHLGTLVPIVDM